MGSRVDGVRLGVVVAEYSVEKDAVLKTVEAPNEGGETEWDSRWWGCR